METLCWDPRDLCLLAGLERELPPDRKPALLGIMTRGGRTAAAKMLRHCLDPGILYASRSALWRRGRR